MNVLNFQKMKNAGRKISVVTCYDYSSARAVAASIGDEELRESVQRAVSFHLARERSDRPV